MCRFRRFALLVFCSVPVAMALTPRHDGNRFDSHALESPAAVLATRPISTDRLPALDPLRVGWDGFAAKNGAWRIYIDQRNGLPSLAQGQGIPWVPGRGNDLAGDPNAVTLETVETLARAFIEEHAALLGTWGEQLVLDTEASGSLGERVWQVTFRQEIDGVRVEGARFDFQVAHGNLVAFGATRWASVTEDALPVLSSEEARTRLLEYLGIGESSDLETWKEPKLSFIAVDPRGARAGEWTDQRGAGLTHRLVWTIHLHVDGEASYWAGAVDARVGKVLSFVDTTHYERAKTSAFPLTSDGVDADGMEQLDYPLAFADYSLDGSAAETMSASGIFTCETGQTVVTRLDGPYVRIDDQCGTFEESSICGDGMDLGSDPEGLNCTTPVGASPGNTQATRTMFYQLNRSIEKARYWLPDNTWFQSPINVRSNVDSTCNASYGGSQLNMYRAGNGCRNTGTLQGVYMHEWGHGVDENDGGGFDGSGEAYADIVAFVEGRVSCVGRGFKESGTCSGYGDTCLECTGIRDHDYAARVDNTPATPANWGPDRCGSGGAPCGGAVHCEGHISAGALFDLAARDFPASGMDIDSAWQLTERLWWESRDGSGGPAYNCSGSTGDSCGTASWYHLMRLVDDDDGDLSNGTPHAAEIWSAFDRHGISCGAQSAPENQSTSSCSNLAQPSLTVEPSENGGLLLTWNDIPNTSFYRVYRTELGCNRAQVPIAEVAAPTLTFEDTDVALDVAISYRVQAVESNRACESAVSNCATAALVPSLGRVQLAKSAFACGSSLDIVVRDGDISGSVDVLIWSDSEQTPEVVRLIETTPGTHKFEGSITSTSAPADPNDGLLTFVEGDQITVRYDDADDGAGGTASIFDLADADCSATAPDTVRVTNITDASARIEWNTAEATRGRVEWGPTEALGNTSEDQAFGTAHAVSLDGLNECGRVFFRVVAIDRVGNERVLDVNGSPFAFNVGMIPGFFRDDFESNGGWTLGGEWEIAPPEGRSAGGSPDPTTAFSSAQVLGHDLTGLGASPGNYEQGSDERAISPSIDASAMTDVEIKFRRWLNVGAYATAIVEVSVDGGAWETAWQRPGSFFPFSQGAWSLETIALPQAGGSSNVRIAYRMRATNQPSTGASWNVDRLVMRESSQPANGPCGECGGAPGFAGAASAVDDDPCSATGAVTISWEEAPAWGTGGAGSYNVYRDTVPDFVPSAANRIATGLTGTSYSDTTVSDGTTYYYVVRAENDETCSTGPANGGVEDDNLIYQVVSTTSSQAVPPEVTRLLVEMPIGDDLRFTWDEVAGDPSYSLTRSSAPQPGGFTERANTTSTRVNDTGAATDGSTWFYLVSATNACGQEGP